MRNAAEETGRAASTAANATAEALRASADLVQRNLETAQLAWETGSQMASQLVERSMGQFGRTTGISGDDAKTAARQASHGLQGMTESATLLASGLHNVSREWLEFSQAALQKNADHLDRLTKCRNAPEIVAAQTDIFRNQLEDFIHSTRRTAELFVQSAEQAARKTSEAARSS
jgi:hypothetical protein